MSALTHRVSLHYGRFKVTVIADEAATRSQFALTPMLGAVDLLADARMDGYLWAGTSGSWEGIDQDQALVAAIFGRTRAPATTATLALIEAFRALGVRRYGLVVPYVARVAQRITENLAAAGYACAAMEHDALTRNWEFAAISADEIAARVRRVAAAGPDAIAIHCTNLRGAEVAASLERELQMPVLDSVAVGLWGVLGLLSVDVPAAEFGGSPPSALSPRIALRVMAELAFVLQAAAAVLPGASSPGRHRHRTRRQDRGACRRGDAGCAQCGRGGRPARPAGRHRYARPHQHVLRRHHDARRFLQPARERHCSAAPRRSPSSRYRDPQKRRSTRSNEPNARQTARAVSDYVIHGCVVRETYEASVRDLAELVDAASAP